MESGMNKETVYAAAKQYLQVLTVLKDKETALSELRIEVEVLNRQRTECETLLLNGVGQNIRKLGVAVGEQIVIVEFDKGVSILKAEMEKARS